MVTMVADVMVATLKDSGVWRVYGIPGDSLNGFTDALRRDGGIAWEHVRHEECSVYCELVSVPAQLPRLLEIAMRAALQRGGAPSW